MVRSLLYVSYVLFDQKVFILFVLKSYSGKTVKYFFQGSWNGVNVNAVHNGREEQISSHTLNI